MVLDNIQAVTLNQIIYSYNKNNHKQKVSAYFQKLTRRNMILCIFDWVALVCYCIVFFDPIFSVMPTISRWAISIHTLQRAIIFNKMKRLAFIGKTNSHVTHATDTQQPSMFDTEVINQSTDVIQSSIKRTEPGSPLNFDERILSL